MSIKSLPLAIPLLVTLIIMVINTIPNIVVVRSTMRPLHDFPHQSNSNDMAKNMQVHRKSLHDFVRTYNTYLAQHKYKLIKSTFSMNKSVATNDYSLEPIPNNSHNPIKHKQSLAKPIGPP